MKLVGDSWLLSNLKIKHVKFYLQRKVQAAMVFSQTCNVAKLHILYSKDVILVIT